jgi:hypothetical protein
MVSISAMRSFLIWRRADSMTGDPPSSSTPQNAVSPVAGSAKTSRRVVTFVAVFHRPLLE